MASSLHYVTTPTLVTSFGLTHFVSAYNNTISNTYCTAIYKHKMGKHKAGHGGGPVAGDVAWAQLSCCPSWVTLPVY
jgi:hypothetical protein